MASSDYDRVRDERPVDSTAPPYGTNRMGYGMPLGIVLALLLIGLLLFGMSNSRDDSSVPMTSPTVSTPGNSGTSNPVPDSKAPTR